MAIDEINRPARVNGQYSAAVRELVSDLVPALKHAAGYAWLAPSIHHTRPWRIHVVGRSLEIYLDRSRQLRVLDPSARQLMISCGCAAFNARVGLAELGWRSRVDRFPAAEVPDLAYRIHIVGRWVQRPPLSDLASAVHERAGTRPAPAGAPLPSDVIGELTTAAERGGARLLPVRRGADRHAVAALARRANAIENADGAYRRELRRAHRLPAPFRSADADQSLLLLGTNRNDRKEWLRAGEALERILLTLTRPGYVASSMNQPVEIRQLHDELRLRLGLTWHPQVVLTAGRASSTSAVDCRATLLDEGFIRPRAAVG